MNGYEEFAFALDSINQLIKLNYIYKFNQTEPINVNVSLIF